MAVEIRGFDFDFDRFRFGLPIVCRQVGLGGDITDRDALGSSACFAIRVGDICGDIVSEDRRIDFGDRAIWFGDKFDLEASVGIGFGPALGDLLRRSLVGSDAPSEAGEEPIGPSHGADDTVANFRILDGRTGVAHRFAAEGDLVIEFDLVFDPIEGDLEFWSFVFFDVDRGGKRAVFDRQDHGSCTAISRGTDRAAERSVVVASHVEVFDDLAVGVLQLQGEFHAGDDFVAVGFAIAARSDPFEVDGLPGSVDGTVGK